MSQVQIKLIFFFFSAHLYVRIKRISLKKINSVEIIRDMDCIVEYIANKVIDNLTRSKTLFIIINPNVQHYITKEENCECLMNKIVHKTLAHKIAV